MLMHQKKSEVQIGKESIGISSDFNPTSPPYFITQKNPDFSNNHSNNDQVLHFQTNPPLISSNDYKIGALNPIQVTNEPDFGSIESPSSSNSTPRNHLLSNPHKRPLMNPTSSIVKSPTLPTSLDNYPFSSTPTSESKYFGLNLRCPSLLLVFSKAKPAVSRLFRRFRHLRRIRVRLRLLLLLAFPFFYFLVSHPSHSFIVDFLSAFAFSAALLVSINIAIPKIPSIRVFLNRSFSFPIKLSSSNSASRPLPVFWSIGSSSKVEKKLSSGCWVQVYSNGDVYEGEFHKGKCAGSGVYYYYMSGRYEGDWIDGKYDGHGVETWARGSRYRGQYRQGLRHGFGVYRFYTGDVYAGEWCNGQSHGCGKHTCEDGSRYVGEFKWGVKHGLGHYHFRNGDSYAGEYFADKMHGFGVYKFSNGHRYEGAWHEGRREGLGMYTFRNGETQAGHWHNGILDVPSTQYATCPVSPVAVNHSKVLNVVQEAREAAERAYDVAKVDERVNRAVAAANRSANAARVAAVKAVQKQMGDTTRKHQTLAPIV